MRNTNFVGKITTKMGRQRKKSFETETRYVITMNKEREGTFLHLRI